MAVVSTSSLGVELVNLHTIEDDINGISEETSSRTAKKSGIDEEIDSCHTARIMIKLVIEVSECPHSCSCVTNSS